MKKILAMIMALMLVLAMTTGIAVMADEPVEATGEQVESEVPAEEGTQPTVPEIPSDVDESSILQYLVFDFKDAEVVTMNSYLTATDPTLDYYKKMYESYGQPVTEGEYDGKRALDMGASEMERNKLADTGIAYIVENGFLADKEYYVYTCGDMLSQGFEADTKIATIVWEFEGKSESHDIIAGKPNSFMTVNYVFNWINIIITLMVFVVLILIIVLIAVALKKKKALNKVENETDYAVEENDVVEEIAEEAVEEAIEEIQEEVAEEIAEDITEE